MAMDEATKAKVMARVSHALDEDERLGESILEGTWEYFYRWLKNTCSDIWEAIKDFAKSVWNWVRDLFN